MSLNSGACLQGSDCLVLSPPPSPPFLDSTLLANRIGKICPCVHAFIFGNTHSGPVAVLVCRQLLSSVLTLISLTHTPSPPLPFLSLPALVSASSVFMSIRALAPPPVLQCPSLPGPHCHTTIACFLHSHPGPLGSGCSAELKRSRFWLQLQGATTPATFNKKRRFKILPEVVCCGAMKLSGETQLVSPPSCPLSVLTQSPCVWLRWEPQPKTGPSHSAFCFQLRVSGSNSKAL